MDLFTTPFFKSAVAAFPRANRALAIDTARALLPFVDESYRQSSVRVIVLGETVQIPKRIHFLGLAEENLKAHGALSPAVQCLRARSTDGYQRQASLKCILSINEPWSVPFVVLLAGEYVIELIEDMVTASSMLDRATYINFVHENRGLMRLLRSRATSYWNCYYRVSYPDRGSYPGLAFLHQLELWAS
jgi:hypothetical protein